jgi:argininosuccinate lyase
MSEKAWGGRFTQSTNEYVESFTSSIHYDKRLAKADILGSMAHAEMLGKIGVLSNTEIKTICTGLEKISQQIEQGSCELTIKHEDIHMHIEHLLTQAIGPVAGKLHTGRSRNDQVALDMHLYLREQVLIILEKLHLLQQSLSNQAAEHIETFLPGYTHLQQAQPIRLAHHLLAYVAMFQRDIERLIDGWPRINTLPLGAAALAGSSFPLDRHFVAKYLGFDSIYDNSMDAVSDRDYLVEFLANASLIMLHISRLSEELILWSSSEFSFVEMDDAFCTGSSMMPQKKNPDVAEIARGKTGRVYGALMGILTLLKGLPLTYNRDLQEDKEGVFDTIDTLDQVLTLYARLIDSLSFNKEAMMKSVQNSFANATAVADYLAKKGLPFREAHSISGKLVLHCIQEKQWLQDLPLAVYKEHSSLFEKDIFPQLRVENVVDSHATYGGPSKQSILYQLTLAKKQEEKISEWIKAKNAVIFFTSPHGSFVE